MTDAWKSHPTGPKRAGPEPSLAGVAVTRGSKRRQGLSEVRVVSPEIVNVVEADTVPMVEGRVCAVVMRDGDAPPGSWTASRSKGCRRNPRGPSRVRRTGQRRGCGARGKQSAAPS